MRDQFFADDKTGLTPAERLRVAVAVLVHGWDQHKVAALMGVNPGRVNEAVTAVRAAFGVAGVDVEDLERRMRLVSDEPHAG